MSASVLTNSGDILSEPGFHKAISENPKDLFNWSIYADWLEENDRVYESNWWRWMRFNRKYPMEFSTAVVDQYITHKDYNIYWVNSLTSKIQETSYPGYLTKYIFNRVARNNKVKLKCHNHIYFSSILDALLAVVENEYYPD